jgi:DNA-binding SARP family transcriptional activator
MANPLLRFALFGGFQLQRGEEFIELPTQKTKSLLAYLALHRTPPLPRETLLGEFWPDVDEERARNSLNNAVSILRKILGHTAGRQPYLLSSLKTLQLNPEAEIQLDSQDFEARANQGLKQNDLAQLRAAAALYTGDFLAGFYDDWSLVEQARLREVYLVVLQTLIAVAVENRQFRLAVQYAQKALEINPLQETVHRHLIYSYYALGDRTSALRQYRECAKRLDTELGLKPLPETQALIEEIEAQSKRNSAARAKTPTRRAEMLLSEYPVLASRFVGRVSELGLLLKQWSLVRRGHGRAIFIGGEAGVGKTRLIHHFLAQTMQDKMHLLWGSCNDLVSKLPYQPLAEALRRHWQSTDKESLSSIDRVCVSELARLVPEFALLLPQSRHRSDSTFVPPEPERPRLLDSVLRYVLFLSEQHPVIFFLDDLQWADEASLQCLQLLVRHLPTTRLMLLGAYRTEETKEKSPWQELLRQAYRQDTGQSLFLARFSPDETDEIVKRTLKLPVELPDLSSQIYGETEGNPFFIIELLKSYVESGILTPEGTGPAWRWDQKSRKFTVPPSIQSMLEARLLRAGKRGRRVLALMACLRRGATLELLQKALEKPEEIILTIVDHLMQQQLIIERDHQFHFSHSKFRDVLLSRLSEMRKRRLHQRTGSALEALHAPDLRLIASELTDHFVHAGEKRRALDYAILAGQHALALYACDEACASFGKAESLIAQLHGFDLEKQKLETRFGLGSLHRLKGEHSQAIPYFEQALVLARKRAEPTRILEALWLLAWEHTLSGDHERAMALLKEARGLTQPSEQSGDSVLMQSLGSSPRGAVIILMGFNLLLQGRLADAAPLFKEALAFSEQAHSAVDQAWSAQGLGAALALQGKFNEALRYLQDSLEHARALNDTQLIVFSLNSLGWVYQRFLDLEKARELHEEAYALAEQLGIRWFWADLQRNLGNDYALLGQTDRAQALLEQALRTAEEQKSHVWAVQSLCRLAEFWLRQNHPTKAEPYLTRLKTLIQQMSGDQFLWAFEGGFGRVKAIEAAYLMTQSKARESEDAFCEALAWADRQGDYLLQWEIHAAQAQLALSQKKEKQASRFAKQAVEALKHLAAHVENEKLLDSFSRALSVQEILQLAKYTLKQ